MAAEVNEYRTLKAPAEAVIREKMSRFLAFAIPVASAEEAKSETARIAREYHDARHVCWAYSLGADGSEQMSNDNGEPSGTAGKPILGQIRSQQLTYLLIVVVRYFGGIKLGTSGLIAAYRAAALAAIEAGEPVTRHETTTVSATFPYMAINDVMRVAKDPEVKITDQVFDNTCSITLRIRADHADALRQKLYNIDGLSLLPPDNIITP